MVAAVAVYLAGTGVVQLRLRCHLCHNSLKADQQRDMISPLPPIMITTALSIASAALLLVVSGLVKTFEGHGITNVAHPTILQ